jgi:hypothetical protein
LEYPIRQEWFNFQGKPPLEVKPLLPNREVLTEKKEKKKKKGTAPKGGPNLGSNLGRFRLRDTR